MRRAILTSISIIVVVVIATVADVQNGPSALALPPDIEWNTRAPMPTGRHSPFVASLGNKIYVAGGETGVCTWTNVLEIYDQTTDSWQTAGLPAIPGNRSSGAAAAANGKIYTLGGDNGCGGPVSVATNQEYDPVANTWTNRAAMPTGRVHHAAVEYGGLIYVFGGSAPGGAALASVHAYNPVADSWNTSLPAMPAAVGIARAVVIGSTIYVHNGDGGAAGALYAFDPASNTWIVPNPTPSSVAQARAFAAALGGKLYVIGGTRSGAILDEVRVYDPSTDSWQLLTPSAPWFTGRGALGGAVVNGRAFAIGGTVSVPFSPPYSALNEELSVSEPDSDGDGVPNAEDACPGTPPGTPVNETGCPVPDLSIVDVKPVQVVFDPDINDDGRIDLVLAKPMMVRVEVSIDSVDLLPSEDEIEVQVDFQGVSESAERSVGELQIDPFIDVPFSGPTMTGVWNMSFCLDPGGLIDELDESNNCDIGDSQFLSLEVKDTRGLHIAYLKVDYLGALSSYGGTVENSGEFIGGVFPVAPPEFINNRIRLGQVDIPYVPDVRSLVPVPCTFPFEPVALGACFDLIRLWTQAQLLTLGQADRVVGVVDPTWFSFHGLTGNGVTWRGLRSVAVRDGFWTTTAHEIGHTFGFDEGYCSDGNQPLCGSCPIGTLGSPASGYWVERNTPLEEAPTQTDSCVTQTPSPNGGAFEYMGASLVDCSVVAAEVVCDHPAFPDFRKWSTRSNFETLFRQFRVSVSDPDVLLVSGVISKDGAVVFEPFYKIEAGVASESIQGGLLVRTLDADGLVVGETMSPIGFAAFTDPPIESDAAPFTLAIPYPEQVAVVEIVHQGTVIGSVEPRSRLLRDAIEAIPDFGFVRLPEQLRLALLMKANGFENQIEAGKIRGALNHLRFDIRAELDRWLVDDYEKTDILQYSKAEILALVDDIGSRLEKQLTLH